MAEPRFTKMGRYGDAMSIEPWTLPSAGGVVAIITVNGGPIHLDENECREVIELLQVAIQK